MFATGSIPADCHVDERTAGFGSRDPNFAAKVQDVVGLYLKQTTTATRTGSSSKRRNTGYRMSSLARAPWLRLGEMGAPCEQF
jgi:hypothetical protein